MSRDAPPSTIAIPPRGIRTSRGKHFSAEKLLEFARALDPNVVPVPPRDTKRRYTPIANARPSNLPPFDPWFPYDGPEGFARAVEAGKVKNAWHEKRKAETEALRKEQLQRQHLRNRKAKPPSDPPASDKEVVVVTDDPDDIVPCSQARS